MKRPGPISDEASHNPTFPRNRYDSRTTRPPLSRGPLGRALSKISKQYPITLQEAMLRDYVNATITFDTLAEELDKSSKSLQRMLGPKGNPTAESLFSIIKALQEFEHLHLEVKATKNAA